MSDLFAGAVPADELPLIWPKTGLRPHRFAGIFRLLVGDERTELDQSIREKGLLHKVLVYQDAILDGRNRYIALVDAGIVDPAVDWRIYPDLFTEFTGSDLDALNRVWMLNEQRRHDSAGERAMAAARYKKFLEALDIPAKLRSKTDRELAAEHGVSERLLNSANAVIGTAEPEIVKAVDEGRVSVTDAAEAARLAREAQVEIAASRDRKTAKRKVQTAKAGSSRRSGPGQPPPLPAPLSRTDLATFAELVVNEARRARKAHGGQKGASISADFILNQARALMLIERDEESGFTRPMLLALNKLRDTMPAKPAKKADKPSDPTLFAPSAPPLGGEWGQSIGGMDEKYTAGFSVFHEEDDTFSVAMSVKFRSRAAQYPFGGEHPNFLEAIAHGAIVVRRHLVQIASDMHDASAAERNSADAGLTWLDKRLAQWGITLPDPVEQVVDDLTEIVGAMVDQQLSYQQLVDAQGDLKGKHTRDTAKPIILAAETAGIPISTIEKDIGHSRGTIGGWRHKLGLAAVGAQSEPRASHGSCGMSRERKTQWN